MRIDFEKLSSLDGDLAVRLEMNNWAQIVLVILQFLLLIIPFMGKGDLWDFEKRRFYKKLTFRGIVFIFLALFAILVALWQFHLSDEIDGLKEEIAEIKQKVRQKEIMDAYIDESLKTKEMLARYGLKVDEKNQEIVKRLNDSSFSRKTIIRGGNPTLFLANLKVVSKVEDKLELKYTIKSVDASGYNTNIKLDFVGAKGDKYHTLYYILKDFQPLAKNSTIKTDIEHSNTLTLKWDDRNFNVVLVRMRATYTNSEGKAFTMDENYGIIFNDDMDDLFGNPMDIYNEPFKNFLRLNP